MADPFPSVQHLVGREIWREKVGPLWRGFFDILGMARTRATAQVDSGATTKSAALSRRQVTEQKPVEKAGTKRTLRKENAAPLPDPKRRKLIAKEDKENENEATLKVENVALGEEEGTSLPLQVPVEMEKSWALSAFDREGEKLS
jgi:hypothetical protein